MHASAELIPWPELRAQLLQRGFSELCYVELTCPQCGDWRGALAATYESPRHPCPRCNAPSEFAKLAKGLTRLQRSEWNIVMEPLRADLKKSDSQKSPTRVARPDREQVAERIRRIAELSLQGLGREEIARKLNVRLGTLKVFAWRKSARIRMEQQKLVLSGANRQRTHARSA